MALVITASLLAHEAGHAVAAHKAGLRVEGIEVRGPMAKTVLATAPGSPATAALVAAAGPAATALLALVGAYLCDWTPADGSHPLADALMAGSALKVIGVILIVINGLILVVNLLPGLPLDGGHLLRALLWRATGDGAMALMWTAHAGTAIGIAGCGVGIALATDKPTTGFLISVMGVTQLVAVRGHLRSSEAWRNVDTPQEEAAIRTSWFPP